MVRLKLGSLHDLRRRAYRPNQILRWISLLHTSFPSLRKPTCPQFLSLFCFIHSCNTNRHSDLNFRNLPVELFLTTDCSDKDRISPPPALPFIRIESVKSVVHKTRLKTLCAGASLGQRAPAIVTPAGHPVPVHHLRFMIPSNGGTLIHRPSASLRDQTLGSSIFRRSDSVRASALRRGY